MYGCDNRLQKLTFVDHNSQQEPHELTIIQMIGGWGL